jgi:TonB-dependent starch-binding outer membrane protein SusC
MQLERVYKTRWWKVMKITFMQLTLLICLVQIGYARAVSAQEMLQRRVTMEMTDRPIRIVLRNIEKTADVSFVYSPEIIGDKKHISVRFQNEPMINVLEAVVRQINASWEIVGGQIILKRKMQMSALPAISPRSATVNQRTVTGNVTDGSNNNPLPGVTVGLAGTTRGTTSDANGNYSIDVPDAGELRLVFSFIGYVRKEVEIGNSSLLNIVLSPSDIALNEVVVVGYGTQKRSDLTGSVSSVSSEDLERVPVTNVNQALQGRAAGVQIRQNQQQPGGELSVRIRGISSIQGNTAPLYVIDGIIGGDINTLNPQDIASLEVLKDASSTAIFGANGANGVILITTKRGNADKTSVNFNSYLGYQKVMKKLDLLNPREYAEIDIARRKLLGQEQVYDLNNLPAQTDWQDVLYQTSPMQNYNLSASGGSKKVRYFASANYINQQGVIINTDFSRLNLRLNLDAEVSSRVKIGTRIGLSRAERGKMNGEGELNNNSPVAGAMLLAPILSPYGPSGNLTPEIAYATTSPSAIALMPNPVHYSKYLIDLNKSTAISGSVFAEFEIIDALKFKPSFNFTLNTGKNNFYKPSTIFNNSLGYRNEARVGSSDAYRWNTDMVLTYQKSIGDHSLDILGGFIVNKTYNESMSSTVRDFALDVFDFHNIGAGGTIVSVGTGMSEKQQLSYIGRVNYSYKNRYLFSFNSRYDGSSVFGSNNRWGFFPSGAAAWKVTEEPFMKDISTFHELKVRTSYGVSGSEALSPYASQARLSSGPSYIINGVQVVGYRPSTIAVPDLQWEQTAQFDLGLDMSFFKGRLGFTADLYKKNTSKLFLSVPLPRTSGVSSVVRNTGTLENTGLEFRINGVISRGPLQWESDLNLSFQKQKVTNIGTASEILLNVGLEGFSNAQVIRVGEPLGAFYGYPNAGIWQTKELAELASAPKQFGVVVKPGDLKYIDQDGDGDVTATDRKIIGYALPKFFGGWNHTLRYKGFDASFFMDFVYGNDIFNVNRYHTMMTIQHFSNKSKEFKEYWTPDNQSNTVPRLDYNQPANALTDYLMEDGSYLRMREVTIGYSLAPKVLSKLKMSKVRLYATATNLFTLTKYTGYNPDVNTYGNNSGIFNVDFGSYPMYSTFLIGFNVGF